MADVSASFFADDSSCMSMGAEIDRGVGEMVGVLAGALVARASG